jgi:hypothetical protein
LIFFFVKFSHLLKKKDTKFVLDMADAHSKETRSYNMSRIKGKDTKPEMQVRSFIQAMVFVTGCT